MFSRDEYLLLVKLFCASFLVGCGTAGPGGPNSPPEPPPAPTLEGTVAADELYMNTMAMWMMSAGAAFYPPADFVVPTPAASVGACSVYTGGQFGLSSATLDAGAITVTGGARDIHLQDASGAYTSDIPDYVVDLFHAGDSLHVVAAGGADVPAFSADVAAPPRPDVSSPCLACGLDVDRTQAFTLRWTPNDGTDIFLELTSGNVVVTCGAPDSAGELTVPVEAVQYLPPTFGSGSGMLMMKRTSRASVVAGAALVSLQISSTECSMGNVR